MAIFTAEEYGGAIERCWLDRRDVTGLATLAIIPDIDLTVIPPPVGVVVEARARSPIFRRNENGPAGVIMGYGSVDILDTDDEGHFFAGPDGKPPATRHYGEVRLDWKQDA